MKQNQQVIFPLSQRSVQVRGVCTPILQRATPRPRLRPS